MATEVQRKTLRNGEAAPKGLLTADHQFSFRVLSSSIQENFAAPPTSLQPLVAGKILRSAPGCSSTRGWSGCQRRQPGGSPLDREGRPPARAVFPPARLRWPSRRRFPRKRRGPSLLPPPPHPSPLSLPPPL